MFAARVLSLFYLAFTFGLVAAAPSPAFVKRADVTDVVNILNNLKQTTGPFAQTISDLVDNNNATEQSIAPQVKALKTALQTASTALKAISGPVSTVEGLVLQDVASLVVEIVQDVTFSLAKVLQIAGVGPLLADIDVLLGDVLGLVGVLLAGVLTLVAALLGDVIGLLGNLAFTHVLGALGLVGKILGI